jgi:hypothetical protein
LVIQVGVIPGTWGNFISDCRKLFQVLSQLFSESVEKWCMLRKRRGELWCHLWADTVEELHKFATILYAPEEKEQHWFCNSLIWPHYDLIPSERHLAILLGAYEMTLDERMAHMRQRCAQLDMDTPLELSTFLQDDV